MNEGYTTTSNPGSLMQTYARKSRANRGKVAEAPKRLPSEDEVAFQERLTKWLVEPRATAEEP